MLLEALTPVQRVMQKLGNPEPQLSAAFVEKAISKLRDGDILLSRENWKLTNLFVPGYWGHAAIYYSGKIIEAIGDYKDPVDGKIKNGVRAENPERWLFQKDSVAILAPLQTLINKAALAAEIAASEINTPYDYRFEPSTKAFYCSELVINSYKEACTDKDPFVLKKQFGVVTSTPQDIYEMRNLFFVLMEERN